MRKMIPIEIDVKDLSVLYKYGFDIERNVTQYLKDAAAEIRYYELDSRISRETAERMRKEARR